MHSLTFLLITVKSYTTLRLLTGRFNLSDASCSHISRRSESSSTDDTMGNKDRAEGSCVENTFDGYFECCSRNCSSFICASPTMNFYCVSKTEKTPAGLVYGTNKKFADHPLIRGISDFNCINPQCAQQGGGFLVKEFWSTRQTNKNVPSHKIITKSKLVDTCCKVKLPVSLLRSEKIFQHMIHRKDFVVWTTTEYRKLL